MYASIKKSGSNLRFTLSHQGDRTNVTGDLSSTKKMFDE